MNPRMYAETVPGLEVECSAIRFLAIRPKKYIIFVCLIVPFCLFLPGDAWCDPMRRTTRSVITTPPLNAHLKIIGRALCSLPKGSSIQAELQRGLSSLYAQILTFLARRIEHFSQQTAIRLAKHVPILLK